MPTWANTLVVRYQKRGRDWYALVSPPFSSLTDARSALSHPVYAQMATQLYPRIRSIDSLRQINSMSVPAIQHERFVDYNDSLSEVRVSLIDSAAQTSPVGLPVSNPFLPEQPEQNILNGSGKRYTIQWFTADRPESIEEMKQRFPELSSAVTVHYRKHQKDWYVLVQGQYRSSSEALSMLKITRDKRRSESITPLDAFHHLSEKAEHSRKLNGICSQQMTLSKLIS